MDLLVSIVLLAVSTLVNTVEVSQFKVCSTETPVWRQLKGTLFHDYMKEVPNPIPIGKPCFNSSCMSPGAKIYSKM